MGNGFRHIAAIATAAQRVVGLIVEGNVEHRAEVEIEPEQAQQAAGQAAVLHDQAAIAALAELLGIRRFMADQPEARYPATLLVDGDDGLGRTQVAQVVGELAQLPGGDDVAPEQDEAAGLEASQPGRGGRIQRRTRHAYQQQFVRFREDRMHARTMAGTARPDKAI